MAIGSALNLCNLRLGQRDHGRRQRLEVHLGQLRGSGADRPVEEGPQVLGPGGAGLRDAHDGVLVVDDRVAARGLAVDERDRPDTKWI